MTLLEDGTGAPPSVHETPGPVPTNLEPERPPVQPRKLAALRNEEWGEYAIAAVSAFHAMWALRILLDWGGLLGSFLCWYLFFVALHYFVVRRRSTAELALDRLATTLVWSIGGIVSATLAWMLVFVLLKGMKVLSWSFLTQDLSTTGALDKGGGLAHAVVGSFEQVGLATIAVVPIAILTAIYLHEFQGKLAGPTRFVVDALSGLPSVVAGLLVFTILPGFSGIKGSIALLVLMLPPVTRASEEILRTVPDGLREASLALGSPRWRVVMRVVVPTARSGLLTAVLLGVARAIGETAPLLLTAFGSTNMNVNPFSGNQGSLSLFVYDLIRVPNKTQNDRAWGGALVLVLLVLILFTTARLLAARSERRLGRR